MPSLIAIANCIDNIRVGIVTPPSEADIITELSIQMVSENGTATPNQNLITE
jgi:hypothetical protein